MSFPAHFFSLSFAVLFYSNASFKFLFLVVCITVCLDQVSCKCIVYSMQVFTSEEVRWCILRLRKSLVQALANLMIQCPVPFFLTVDSGNPIVVLSSHAWTASWEMDPFTALNMGLPLLFSYPRYVVAHAPLQHLTPLNLSSTALCIFFRMDLAIMTCFKTTVRTLQCIAKLVSW